VCCILLHALCSALCSRSVAASALRLEDYALLEPTGDGELYYLGPAGSGPRDFVLDAGGVVISQAKRWIELARRKYRGFMNIMDPTAVSMSITGTPKVRLCAYCIHASCVRLTCSKHSDWEDASYYQSTACVAGF